MVRKCRQIAEVTLMEVSQVGGRTRAQAALEIEASRSRSRKRRKVGEGKLMVSSKPDVQLRSRKRLVNAEENSFPLMRSAERNSVRSVCSGPSSDQAAASCCSSNRSGELEDEIIDLSELEGGRAEVESSTYNDSGERREATPTSQLSAEDMSNDVESTVGQTDDTSRWKMPIQSEIEEFFICAEEDLRKRFSVKYNYDIVKDEPLEGRYEWARVKTTKEWKPESRNRNKQVTRKLLKNCFRI